jgi:tetratricopeptide (TPR) repeat protein
MIDTRKAQELDIVELKEDLPKYGVKKGERAVVITAFDEPDEAYDLEFVDESGTSSRFAYSVKPDQIISADEAAKEAFERGIALFNQGDSSEGEIAIREAIQLRPEYIALLHNLVVERFENTKDWLQLIAGLRLVLRLNPNYEEGGNELAIFAKNNLALAYQNYGVELAKGGNRQEALVLFDMALGVGPIEEVASLIKRNIAKAYTWLGIEAYKEGEPEKSFGYMRLACEAELSKQTRHNLGVALIYLALHHKKNGDSENAAVAFEYAVDTGLLGTSVLGNERDWSAISLEQIDEAIKTWNIKPEFFPALPMQQQDFIAT